ncbi:MAG TPA: HGGxSTG domain-containing protein [Burkholderiales bacterium]|nr:HGGxSTG domain-containing protein [Burkholderiales bacterium]
MSETTAAAAARPPGARPDAAAVARMLASARCGARTRSGRPCRAPAVSGKARCRKHGAAAGSGGQAGNRNAHKDGFYSAEEKAQRRRIMDFVRECNRVLEEIDRIDKGR